MKLTLIEQRRVDLRGRAILKPLLMKTGQYRYPLGFRECPRRMPLRGHSNRRKTAAAPPVPAGSRHRQRLAGWLHTHQRAELIDRGHHDRVVISHDICYRTRLTRFGGHGYGHIFTNVLPMMRRRGFSDQEIDSIIVSTPKRLLTIL